MVHDAAKSEPTHDAAQAVEVFYDGGCPICSREIAVYKRMASADPAGPLAQHGAWRDISPQDAATPAEADRETLMRRFHARRADGRLVSGAAAFFAVWRATPKLAWLGRLLDRQPFIAIADLAYAGFLAVRPLWRRGGSGQG